MKKKKSGEKKRKRQAVTLPVAPLPLTKTEPRRNVPPADRNFPGTDDHAPEELALKAQGKLAMKRRLEALSLLEQAVGLDPSNREYAAALAELREDVRARPTISVCMMVKNEEAHLERCLKSVQGFVDEIIVVDTGSRDRTMDIARAFDVLLFEHPWFDDFSGMRNITIGYAQGDWIVILDGDEELEAGDGELIREAATDTSCNGKYFQVHNLLENGAKDWVCESVRMFKNDGHIRYEGIVHNNIVISPPIQTTPIRIYHYGYDLDAEKKAAKFERTTSLLKKVLAETPDDARAMFYLMKSYGSAGKKEEAIEYGERFLELARGRNLKLTDTYWYEALWTLSAAWIASGDLEKAEEYVKKGMDLDPDYADMYHLLGKIRGSQGNFEEVKHLARTALEKLDRHVRGQVSLHYMHHYARHEMLFYLAAAHCELGECDDGLARCDEAIQEQEKNADYHLLRSRILLKQGKPEEARQSLAVAGQLDPQRKNLKIIPLPSPERIGAQLREAMSALQGNDVLAAMQIFRDVLNADPTQAVAHGWLARLTCGRGETETALEHARRALEADRNELALLAMAEIHLKKEEFPAALDYLLECVEKYPESPHANHLMGIGFWRRGRRLQATPYLEKAITLEPANESYRQALEAARRDTNRQPTISLCMMVKNEENNLDRLLESVEGAVDEIVVVDTGSTDSTIDIARRFHVRLYEHPWFQDFSGMRNITIGYGRGDWILILDADEELVAEDRQLVRDVSMDTSVNGFQFIVHNQFAKAGHDFKGRSVRLFKNNGEILYEGIVHNDLVIGPPVLVTSIRLNHYGYDLDEKGKAAKFERTSGLLHKVIEENPENAPAHFYLLKAYAGHNQKERAIAFGEKFLELALSQDDPKNGLFRMEVNYLMGMLHLTMGRLDEARKYGEDGIAFCHYYPDNYFLMAKVEGREKHYEKAREYGLRSLQYLEQFERGETQIMCVVHPSRHEILLDVATASYELNDYDEALRQCREALAASPENAPLNMLAAKIFLKQEKGREALEALAVVERLDPDRADLPYHQGRCFLTLERYQEAHALLTKFVEKNPDHGSTHHYLGKIELKWHRFEEAEKHLSRAAELDPVNADLHNELALVLEHNGKIPEALNAFEQMNSINSQVEGLRNKIGEMAFSLGDGGKARDYFQAEIERFPHVSSAYNNLAVLLAGEGKLQDAVACLHKCLEIDPGNSTARENLQELQSMLGEEFGSLAIN